MTRPRSSSARRTGAAAAEPAQTLLVGATSPVGAVIRATLHLELHQPVEHFDRVPRGQFLGEDLLEASDDQIGRLVLGEAAAHQVEDLARR